MAVKEFILQGFTTRTHASAIREMFEVPEIRWVLVSVAFVSKSGVQQLETQLRLHKACLTVFAGIRNDITSYQGLLRLFEVAKDLYTIHTGSRTILFHPKLCLVCGKAEARLIIGSANVTLGGLNNNIEAGMLIKFDLENKADRAVVEQVKTELFGLPKEYQPH